MTRKRIALYLPLGDKRMPWGGLGGADKRLSYLISHMDSRKFDVKIIFRIFEAPNRIVAALEKYISKSCGVIFVYSDIEAFKHFYREKYDYLLDDDCMVKTIPGVLGAILGGSHRILIFVTASYASWKFNKKWYSLIMYFNGILSNKIDCLYPTAKKILERIFKQKNVSITPCSLPFLNKYLTFGRNAQKERVIVFAGRLIEAKNPMSLIETARILRNDLENANYRVLICGAGPLEGAIKDYINQNNLHSVVRFLGPQNMFDILPKARIFCSLQKRENYPSQSLLEAIACGCYCIATNVGNTKALIKESFGTLINNDMEELKNALLYAISLFDKEHEKILKSATEFAEKNFNPEKAIQHYEVLCTNL